MRAVLAVALCAAPLPSGAQTGPLPAATSACVTLERAIALSLERDPRIGRAAAGARRAEAQVRVERSNDRPQLSAFARSGFGEGGSIRADNQFDNRAGLRVSQRLYSFGRSQLAIGAAEQRAAGSRYGVRAAELEVVAEASERFLGIQRGEERIAAAEAMSADYERDLAQVDRRLEVGLIKLSEASGLRAEAARARARVVEERLAVQQERTALAAVTGAPACIVAEPEQGMLVGRQPPSLQVALDEADLNSPELSARAAELSAARLDQRREARERLPDIGVSGVVAFDLARNDPNLDGGRSSRLGLDITMPLYQGGRTAARAAAAAGAAESLDFALRSERRLTAQEVEIAWIRTRELAPIAELNGQTLAALQAQAAATEQEYVNGLATLTELIEVRRQEHQGRLADIDARYELMNERLRLLRLTARIVGISGSTD